MKIGILTFHCAHNYGAVLQCYATQEFLRGKGYDVEVINYRPYYLLRPYQLFNYRRVLCKNPIRLIKKFIQELLLFPVRYKRWCAFEGFINEQLQLGSIVTNKSLPKDCGVYLIGSDQVWNPKITNGFDDVYFGQFPFAKAMKRYVAYAASMEAKKLEDEEISFYKSRLSNFDAISVREKELLSLLQVHVDQPIKQVLDPTLMVSSDLWDKLSSKKKIKGKYVVVYQVRNNKNTLRIANYIANQLNAKVVVLVAWLQINYQNTYQTSSPEDFVNIIRNAACVVTTSFHGTAFSIIFNRPFYTVRLNDGADSRSSSLLESLGLENRMINIDDSPVFTTIDYTAVNPILNSLRQQSQEFLLSNL